MKKGNAVQLMMNMILRCQILYITTRRYVVCVLFSIHMDL